MKIILIILIFIISINNIFSQKWMYESIEYKSICAQTYLNAKYILDSALKDKLWTAELSQINDKVMWDKKPAIIIDLDETVLDNSGFFEMLEERDTTYNSEMWNEWLALSKASAIVGSVDFIKFAESKGIEIFYITNRLCNPNDSIKCPEQDYTIANLKKLGIETDDYHVLLRNEYKNWTGNKQIRRSILIEQYRILMLIGDDLNDFVDNAIELTYDDKYKLFINHYDYWGSKWFMLPNPKYGSWNKTN